MKTTRDEMVSEMMAPSADEIATGNGLTETGRAMMVELLAACSDEEIARRYRAWKKVVAKHNRQASK